MDGIPQTESADILIRRLFTRLAVQEADTLTVTGQDVEVLALAHHHIVLNELLVTIGSQVILAEVYIFIPTGSDTYKCRVNIIAGVIYANSVMLIVRGYLRFHL